MTFPRLDEFFTWQSQADNKAVTERLLKSHWQRRSHFLSQALSSKIHEQGHAGGAASIFKELQAADGKTFFQILRAPDLFNQIVLAHRNDNDKLVEFLKESYQAQSAIPSDQTAWTALGDRCVVPGKGVLNVGRYTGNGILVDTKSPYSRRGMNQAAFREEKLGDASEVPEADVNTSLQKVNEALGSGMFVYVRKLLQDMPAFDLALLLESSPTKTRAVLWQLVDVDHDHILRKQVAAPG